MNFDMTRIGRTIARRRKEKNMTQSDLAQVLGVSHQAVSFWENGNTMPDIGKLGDLSRVLDISIDELLENPHISTIVAKVENKQPLDKEDLLEIAPIAQPKQLSEAFEKISETWGFKDMVSIIPYLNEEAVDRWVLSHPDLTIKQLTTLAPFLSDEQLNQISDRLAVERFGDLVPLAPFLEEAQLAKLVAKINFEQIDTKQVVALAPFLDKQTLRNLFLKLVSEDHLSHIQNLFPFLDDETLSSLGEKLVHHPALLKKALPFMEEEQVDASALAQFKESLSLPALTESLPFMSDEGIEQIIDEALTHPDIKGEDYECLYPFVDERALRKIIKTYSEWQRLDEIRNLFHFL